MGAAGVAGVSPLSLRMARERRQAPALALVWGSWLLVMLALGLVGVASGSPQWIGEIAVLLHGVIALMILVRCYSRRMATILGLSLVLRISLVFWDLNFSAVFSLPNSGADTEMFYHYALAVAEDPSLIFEDIRGGMFSKVFGILFWTTGVHRVVGQYVNVLLGLSAVMLVEAITRRLPIEDVRRLQVLAVIALLPNSLILSAIFLRESIIAFLIAVSAYFFVRWFRGGGPRNILLVLLAVLAASVFHAGVVAVGAGYMVVAVLYRQGARKFGFGWQSLVYLALFAVVIRFVVAEYPDVFLGKFEVFDSEEDLLASANRRGGGSQYLTSLTVDSYADMVIFGPLRAFYFLGAPLPWDARGVVDLFTFFTDSLFYLGSPVIFFAVRGRLTKEERTLGFALLIVIAVSSLVFGAGVSNAGTAVRHRFKVVALFMVLLAVAGSGVGRAVRRGGLARSRVSGSRSATGAMETNRPPVAIPEAVLDKQAIPNNPRREDA